MTLYAFSRENWARSDDEVRGLFALLEQAIRSETAELSEQGVRIRLLGRLDELPDDTRRSIERGARGDRRRRPPPPERRVQLRRPDRARRRVPAARGERRRPGRDRRGRDLRRALHRRPARSRPRHPDRRRAAALELPHLAVGLRGAVHDRGPLAGLRRRRLRRGAARVRQPDATVRSLNRDRGTGAGSCAQRAISAAVLVPPLLVALLLGGPWIVAVVAVVDGPRRARGLRAPRRGRLSVAAAGWASRSPLASSLDAAIAGRRSSGSGLLLLAIGSILAGGRRVHPARPARRSADWFATVFGAIYASLLGFVLRLGQRRRRCRPARRWRGSARDRGWIAPPRARRLGYDTGRVLHRQAVRAAAVPHPHLAVEDLRRADRRDRRRDVVVAAVLVGARPAAVIGARSSGRCSRWRPRPATSPNRCSSAPPGPRTRARLIPGHGGILDRVDSFLFAAPVVTLYVIAAFR